MSVDVAVGCVSEDGRVLDLVSHVLMHHSLYEILIVSVVIDEEKPVVFLHVDTQVCEVLPERRVAAS